MSKLPSGSTVLPAELEVLELGLLVALLKDGKRERILESDDRKGKQGGTSTLQRVDAAWGWGGADAGALVWFIAAACWLHVFPQ
jgi:hypothetical protein